MTTPSVYSLTIVRYCTTFLSMTWLSMIMVCSISGRSNDRPIIWPTSNAANHYHGAESEVPRSCLTFKTLTQSILPHPCQAKPPVWTWQVWNGTKTPIMINWLAELPSMLLTFAVNWKWKCRPPLHSSDCMPLPNMLYSLFIAKVCVCLSWNECVVLCVCCTYGYQRVSVDCRWRNTPSFRMKWDEGVILLRGMQTHVNQPQHYNNNNNVTCIGQIRQGRKCATTCQCQTGMFSVVFWMWPEISQLTAGRVAENSTRRDHERRNYGCRNLSWCVEWWAGDYGVSELTWVHLYDVAITLLGTGM